MVKPKSKEQKNEKLIESIDESNDLFNRPKTTQRAYTLILKGSNPDDQSWRMKLWKTHEAINHGVKAFGDWLLTLRGGIDQDLVTITSTKNQKLTDQELLDQEKSLKILLALSWLSVESRDGAPKKYIVATGEESSRERSGKVIEAFRKILRSRGMKEKEIKIWELDCGSSLSASIRSDAVWVNRSQLFDDLKILKHRDGVWDFLGNFLGGPATYLELEDVLESSGVEKNMIQNASLWLSRRFGTGKGADYEKLGSVYASIKKWAISLRAKNRRNGPSLIEDLVSHLKIKEKKGIEAIQDQLSAIGHKSRTKNVLTRMAQTVSVPASDIEALLEAADNDSNSCTSKIGMKGHKAYSDKILQDVENECGFKFIQCDKSLRYEFNVMLDHAARKVSSLHAWIKRAEIERRRFSQDAEKMSAVPKDAREWLDQYRAERFQETGAIEDYLITKAAIKGWADLLEGWSETNCKDENDRIAAIKKIQSDPEMKKGDVRLFEALASDKAQSVWKKGPQVLIDYVAASMAEASKKRFKVPSYRHPDPLLHPIFCDYGSSRWKIQFLDHKSMAQNKLSRRMDLGVLDKNKITTLPLLWSNKRFVHDIFPQSTQNGHKVDVSRASRLSRAAAGAESDDVVEVMDLFQQKEWNGRLQVPREDLDRIAKVHQMDEISSQQKLERIKALLMKLDWYISFSAKLRTKGPWHSYIHSLNDQSPFIRGPKGNLDFQGWPFNTENSQRNGYHSKLILSRLPGLSILGVHLGIKHSAACAVWRSLSQSDFKKECAEAQKQGAKIVIQDLYAHVFYPAEKSNAVTEKARKEGRIKTFRRTTIYRRIGADKLTSGEIHPAPWARLERQFFIKLQGEDGPAREASNEEIWLIHRFESEWGKRVPLIDRLTRNGWGQTEKQKIRIEALRKLGWSAIHSTKKEVEEESDVPGWRESVHVDDLMSSLIDSARQALKRHGDYAKIAYNLTAKGRSSPGDRTEPFRDRSEQLDFITETLVIWYKLISNPLWGDEWARDVWKGRIDPLLKNYLAEFAKDPKEKLSRKEYEEELREKLLSVAGALENASLKGLSELWTRQWNRNDERWRGKEGYLRLIQKWVLPRKKNRSGAIQNVGGLSLSRIATIKSFHQLQKAYSMRPYPDDPKKNIPKESEPYSHFGSKALNALDQLRENRAKQLASRIIEAALGVGTELSPAVKRPENRVYDPCQVVVIENLDNYRTDELNTRKQNQQIMDWAVVKIQNYLKAACELNGLHYREVLSAYTMLQDSRTGSAGIRCQDIDMIDFLRNYWREQVNRVKDKVKKDKGTLVDRYLIDMDDWIQKGLLKNRTLRLPARSGEIFVSSNLNSPSSKGIHASLNAAANIALKALMDPDWSGKWWYIPCDSEELKPLKTKVHGSEIIDLRRCLPIEETSTNDKSKRKGIVNLWRHLSMKKIHDDKWFKVDSYWNEIQSKSLNVLRMQAGV